MGTVKKMTLMMALVTGSITALMRSSMLSWAWASSGRHDRSSRVNRWIIGVVLSDLRMLNAQNAIQRADLFDGAEHKQLARVVERRVPHRG